MTHLTLECSAQLANIGGVNDDFTTRLVQQIQEHIDGMKSNAKGNDELLWVEFWVICCCISVTIINLIWGLFRCFNLVDCFVSIDCCH